MGTKVKEEVKIEETVKNDITTVTFKEYHSKAYLDKLKTTKYKDKDVVFILANGKEYK